MVTDHPALEFLLPTSSGHAVGVGTVRSVSRLQRITSDPAVCHGQPTVVRGLRYPVKSLLELLSSGMTIEEVARRLPGPGA